MNEFNELLDVLITYYKSKSKTPLTAETISIKLLIFNEILYTFLKPKKIITNRYFLNLLVENPEQFNYLQKNSGSITEFDFAEKFKSKEESPYILESKFRAFYDQTLTSIIEYKVDKLYNQNKKLKEINEILGKQIKLIFTDFQEFLRMKLDFHDKI